MVAVNDTSQLAEEVKETYPTPIHIFQVREHGDANMEAVGKSG